MTRGFWRDPERYVETYWRRIPGRGSTATGRSSTTTASGTSTAAPTTRSRSPASASARPRSRPAAIGPPGRGRGRRDRRARTRSRARRSSSSARSGRGETDDEDLRGGDRATASSRTSARRSSPEAVAVVRRPAEDAIGQDHAARRPGRLARPRSGRPVGARRSGDDRGDPPGRPDRRRGGRPLTDEPLMTTDERRARGRDRPMSVAIDKDIVTWDDLDRHGRGPRRPGSPGPSTT